MGDLSLSNEPEPKKRRKIMEEDAYLASLNAIIQRDFFPDLPKLKLQVDLLNAAREGDIARIQEIHNIQKEGNEFDLPAPFETPSGRVINVHFQKDTNEFVDSEGNCVKVNLGLDSFLSDYTSEDNDSFSEIVAQELNRFIKKYPWLNGHINHHLCLDHKSDIDEQQHIKYEPRNSLMYIPDGAPLSASELLEATKGPPKKVSAIDTRFPDGHMELQREILNSSQQEQETEVTSGRVGERTPQFTSRIRTLREDKQFFSSNGLDGGKIADRKVAKNDNHSYVHTPSPVPGEQFTPFMTWGTVDGTPLILSSGSDTPAHITATSTSRFNVPETPIRDKIGQQLVGHSKQKFFKSNHFSSFTGCGKNTTTSYSTSRIGSAARIPLLSPAARKMLSSQLNIKSSRLDSQLRASYSGTPKPITPSMMKPVTPQNQKLNSSFRSSSFRSTSDGGSSPIYKSDFYKISSGLVKISEAGPSSSSSVTDGLLNL